MKEKQPVTFQKKKVEEELQKIHVEKSQSIPIRLKDSIVSSNTKKDGSNRVTFRKG